MRIRLLEVSHPERLASEARSQRKSMSESAALLTPKPKGTPAILSVSSIAGWQPGNLWLWVKGKPLSMAVARQPVGGVSRLSGVYTPPESRGLGYAAACVYGLSKSRSRLSVRSV